MIRAEPLRPERIKVCHPVAQDLLAGEFDAMTLAIIKTDRLDARKIMERPSETDCGVLPTGQKHKGT